MIDKSIKSAQCFISIRCKVDYLKGSDSEVEHLTLFSSEREIQPESTTVKGVLKIIILKIFLPLIGIFLIENQVKSGYHPT